MARKEKRNFVYDDEPVKEAEDGILKKEVEDQQDISLEVNDTVDLSDEQPKETKAEPVIDYKLVKELRLRDASTNKTCSVCMRRVTLDEIDNGKGEICKSCKE